MQTFSARTSGEDIFVAIKNIYPNNGLDLKNLRGICADGALSMTGNLKRFVARFSEYVSKEYDNKQLTNLHGIIYQEALCVKSVALNTTLTLSLLRSSIDDLVFSVFPSNFVKLSYKISLLKNRFVTLFFIRFS